MRKSAALLFLTLLFGTAAHAEDIDAVNEVAVALDRAFANVDSEKIRALITPDHIAIMPYFGDLESVDSQIDSMREMEGFRQTNLTEPKVSFLAPDVAIRTMKAKWEGTLRGKPFSDRVFITEVLTKKTGKWLERFYQVTKLP